MEFLSVCEFAEAIGKSERTVRNYCSEGKIKNAQMVGKTWNIPKTCLSEFEVKNQLLQRLLQEMKSGVKGGIYHKTQILLTYNSNHIEGSTLTEEQTRYIFETNTIGVSDKVVNIDDIIETTNHFKCFDFIIENATKPLSENMIKKIHCILKSGTSDSKKSWFNVGEYKSLPNEVGGKETCAPENVKKAILKLLNKYQAKKQIKFEDVVEFHRDFETIHPFQDGNGRVGRLVMFKECLKNNIVPFIITDALKFYYYRGLSEWKTEKGYLLDTCGMAQDQYKKYLDYFKIHYND